MSMRYAVCEHKVEDTRCIIDRFNNTRTPSSRVTFSEAIQLFSEGCMKYCIDFDTPDCWKTIKEFDSIEELEEFII